MKEKTLVTGFPRIGEKRELKKALESYWAGRSSLDELKNTASALRKKHWILQKEKGIDLISCNDFSLYDNMLDTAVMVNAIPERFRAIREKTDTCFSMARGCESSPAMGMSKWFNTNYHYIVPELDDSIKFTLDASKIMAEYSEAKNLGITPKINVIGPLTFLGLSRAADGESAYKYLDGILPVYEQLVREISAMDETVYLQMDEPLFVKGPSHHQLEMLKNAYDSLANASQNVRIIVTTYFEHSNEATAVLADTPVWGIGLDFVHGIKNMEALHLIKGKRLVAGVIDGRNIWINDLEKSISLLERISGEVNRDQIIISTSCSLLHVPYSLENEPDSEIKKWLSFASEKLDETALLGRLFHSGSLTENDRVLMDKNAMAGEERKSSSFITRSDVLKRINGITKKERDGESQERLAIQKKILKLPILPSTTIGSFPQTMELRKLRKDFKNRIISQEQYERGIKNHIDKCVLFQEEAGLDVFVHGEGERNDMVEYFGEMLEGFHFTSNGWVQSYGSRCVKPPVIYGDIKRPKPMTVNWITYAQSKTSKPMKGMLTGPVTILNWSFVRDDMMRSEVSKQIALALSDEIEDLQAAGIRIIQVDEAAFKEGYPLRKENIRGYEKWAVENFRLAVSMARKETQIHTHMCYSEFEDIIETIEEMDADVITIETARSGNKLLDVFKKADYKNQIGPGVYDIHSPRVPSVEEFIQQIESRIEVLPSSKLWINPDCGLKTRNWEEVKPALINMVQAVRMIRNK